MNNSSWLQSKCWKTLVSHREQMDDHIQIFLFSRNLHNGYTRSKPFCSSEPELCDAVDNICNMVALPVSRRLKYQSWTPAAISCYIITFTLFISCTGSPIIKRVLHWKWFQMSHAWYQYLHQMAHAKSWKTCTYTWQQVYEWGIFWIGIAVINVLERF